ncbi:helicase C-terminal domain-containing protein [Pilobolus umbonatus]|nr:helicase C-terminal domain-containing protein [Pilobolus umbonatus]
MSTHPYGFPFPPYSVQNEFMDTLYKVLSEGHIGIFESPTGTGKSLSLLCGSMTWLNDHYKKSPPPQKAQKRTDDEPDWVTAFQPIHSREEDIEEERIIALRERVKKAKEAEKNQVFELAAKEKKRFKGEPMEEDDVLDDYDSDESVSTEVKALLEKFNNKKKKMEEEEGVFETKIFYASRTHSQLSQFVHEIRKTVYADTTFEVSMASRKNMCINKEVNKLKSATRINETCLDLQKNNPCAYLPPMDERGKWNQFIDHTLTQVRDIEDIVKVGEKLSVCPYYGSRQTAKVSQIVVLPYQHLLHASTRQSLGISLKNSVIIIDEAHNLIETMTALYTIQLSKEQLKQAWSQLNLYLEKYKTRLLGKNVVYIQQIMRIIKILILQLIGGDITDSVLRVNDFVHNAAIDHINMFKIKHYLEESQLARKLNGFIDKQQEEPVSSMPILTQVESFLLTLTQPEKDGRIVVNKTEGYLKYMLLNPADVFRPLVEEARCVILAGGTMEPVSDFYDLLFPSVPRQEITHFSCGHIVPRENLLTITVDEGATRKPLLFNFESRQDKSLMDDIGQSILNLCQVIPDGIVCFFPSFTYLDQVYERWKSVVMKNGTLLSLIEKKKKVFKEPRDQSVDDTLRDYTLQIHSNDERGAILLCVVNGKMSEGINFSDRLGRGIIMIGLPFANRGSIELTEKMKFAQEQSSNKDVDAGKEYYENLCMRGVNQSIGRAIRHKGDYATIILLDTRYNTPRLRNKLPKWINNNIEHCDKFGKVMGRIGNFFRQKRSNEYKR